MKNIQNLIMQALAHTLNINNSDKIKMTDQLKEDLGLDSMSSLTFLIRLEETIPGFMINPDTLESDALTTVSSITKYVEDQVAQQSTHTHL